MVSGPQQRSAVEHLPNSRYVTTREQQIRAAHKLPDEVGSRLPRDLPAGTGDDGNVVGVHARQAKCLRGTRAGARELMRILAEARVDQCRFESSARPPVASR